MSLVTHLMQREKLELAKELALTAKDNAHLRERVARLECELFWLKAPAPDQTIPATVQQALDTIDAARLRRAERMRADQQHQGAEHRSRATTQS